MKTTIATIIALGLAGLTFAQTPATPAPADSKAPAATTKVKKHKKAVKKADKAAVSTTAPAPVKK